MGARVLALLLIGVVGVAQGDSGEDGPNPVSRVVKLLTEMKQQVEAEAKEDDDIYDKMACWCETYDREKTEAIKVAEARIDELAAAIEEGTATAGRLEGEIAQLQAEIQENQDALETAVAMREKEKAEFEDESKDMMDALAALKEALAVLSKVQLLQAKGAPLPRQMLLQVRSLVSRVGRAAELLPHATGQAARYKSVMQKDLWDMLGAIGGPPRVLTGLSQEAQPTGAAAGATSYSARSSVIFGLLSQMEATFKTNLAESQKEELEAEIAFQRLKAAKVAEIEAAGKAAEEKSAQLADTNQKVAQAKQDIVDTRAALAADQAFLVDLKKRCATADEEHAARQKTRLEEIAAIGEAITILSQDDARDVFSKTLSLLQVGIRQRRSGSQLAVDRRHASAALLAVARRMRHGTAGLALARLAVGVQLDGFEKVKALMDKMVVELKKQQKEEYEKHESCKSDIDANEDATRVKQSEQKDVEGLLASLEGQLAQLGQDLEDLKAQVAEGHVALKAAGEQRKAENHEFQQTVADQRATVQILQKALTRLRAFYAKKSASFLARGRQEPGAAVPPPPASGKAYSANAAAGGVLQILEKIVQDAQRADQEAVAAEQASQEAYAEFVRNTNSMLDAAATSINEKTIQKEKATADKLTAKKELAAVETSLGELADENKALHLGCDYLLKNFNIRQQGRQEEIEAIQEAKAILSGANFGDA